jgi:cysteinyl-tRNA synthetase
MLKFKNTLSGEIEEFKPIQDGQVKMYNCGPTVYDYAHIGNLRSYVFADVLKKTLEYNGYDVTQVINITDVGHLTEDQGLDKVEEKAKKEGKTTEDIADFFTRKFFEDLNKLNINMEGVVFPRASRHINEQIEMIKILEAKGYTYKTSDGIYFDTKKFEGYGKLGNINILELKEGARVEKNDEKRNFTDFALWKFSPKDEKRQQEWPSPWGTGFPGWHIECSAMSMKYLGETFDIHTGGIDHIPVHHNNEIAQSESATGKQFVNYWLHNAFLNIKGDKISKSLGNLILLDNIIEKGLNPLSYRYWLLTASYSSPTNFTWEALEGSNTALNKLKERLSEMPNNGNVDDNYRALFKGFINDDLNTPRALALIWDILRDEEISDKNKKATILDFDKVLGLGLNNFNEVEIPHEVKVLAEKRAKAREEKDWQESDKLRKKMEKLGFSVKDTPDGFKIVKI